MVQAAEADADPAKRMGFQDWVRVVWKDYIIGMVSGAQDDQSAWVQDLWSLNGMVATHISSTVCGKKSDSHDELGKLL